MTTDPDGRALLAGIRANPDDAARWGVAADWFRERGKEPEADVLARREDVFALACVRVANGSGVPVAVYVTAGRHTVWIGSVLGPADTADMNLPPGLLGRPAPLPVSIDVRHPDRRWWSRYPQTQEDWVSCGQVRLGGPWGWEWGVCRFAAREPVIARVGARAGPAPFDLVTVEWRTTGFRLFLPDRIFDNWGTD